MLPRLSIAVIGCGHWGTNYIRIFDSLESTRVTACCDNDPRKLEGIASEKTQVELFTDYRRLAEKKEVDAVVVATTATTHFPIAQTLLENGKHVLVEKPLASSGKDCLALGALAGARGKTLMVGHTFLFNAGVRKVKEYITSGEIGDIYYVRAARTHLGLVRKDVSATWDLAPHDISIFSYWLGQNPLSVSCAGSAFLSDNSEDFAFLTLHYPGGIIGHIFVSWVDSNKTREISVVGSRARVVFDDLNAMERVKLYQKGLSIDKPYSSFGEFQLLLRDGDIISPRIEASEPLKNLCTHFVECIRTGRTPIADARNGYEVVHVLETACRSKTMGGETIPIPWEERAS
jgi:predicted dehydrogenase